MNEEEIHKINRKICLDFIRSSIENLEMPFTLLDVYIHRQNQDFKFPLVKSQKQLQRQLQKISNELKSLGMKFDY